MINVKFHTTKNTIIFDLIMFLMYVVCVQNCHLSSVKSEVMCESLNSSHGAGLEQNIVKAKQQ